MVTLVVISLAVITLDYREGDSGPLASLGRGLLSVMAPMQRGVTDATRPVGNFFIGLAHLPSLQSENQDLKDQVAQDKAQILRQQELERKYDALLQDTGLRDALYPSGVVASVIANGVGNFDWSLTIDRGSNQGVARDMAVIAGSEDGPQLVGRVVEVTGNSATVQLIIDRGAAAAAYLATSDETGLVTGQGEDDLVMEQVTPGTEVAADEPVFTKGYEVSGQPGLYPPDILIGTVSRSFTSEDDVQELVTVRPAVDFSTLDFVLVLRSPARGAGE